MVERCIAMVTPMMNAMKRTATEKIEMRQAHFDYGKCANRNAPGAFQSARVHIEMRQEHFDVHKRLIHIMVHCIHRGLSLGCECARRQPMSVQCPPKDTSDIAFSWPFLHVTWY